MRDITYPPIIVTAKTLFKVLDLRFDMAGTEHVPTEGGALLAFNHVSYVDFVLGGLAAQPSKRLVRFMAKREIFDNAIAGPVMRSMHHICVDRAEGAESLRRAKQYLADGEVVGVGPVGVGHVEHTPRGRLVGGGVSRGDEAVAQCDGGRAASDDGQRGGLGRGRRLPWLPFEFVGDGARRHVDHRLAVPGDDEALTVGDLTDHCRQHVPLLADGHELFDVLGRDDRAHAFLRFARKHLGRSHVRSAQRHPVQFDVHATVAGRGMVSRLSILLGVVVGWIFAALTGNLGDDAVAAIDAAPWVGLPECCP